MAFLRQSTTRIFDGLSSEDTFVNCYCLSQSASCIKMFNRTTSVIFLDINFRSSIL